HPCSLCQVVPECANSGVGITPLLDDRQYFCVAAAVVTGDTPPCADRSTKSAGEFGTFSELALSCDDLADRRVLMQHAVGENTIEIEFFVTGCVETPEGFEFPSLASRPCIDTAFNGAEVGADQCVPRGAAQRRAGQFADDFERIAPA